MEYRESDDPSKNAKSIDKGQINPAICILTWVARFTVSQYQLPNQSSILQMKEVSMIVRKKYVAKKKKQTELIILFFLNVLAGTDYVVEFGTIFINNC